MPSVPIYTPTPKLPAAGPILASRDQERMDAVGLDGEGQGGITFSCVVRVVANGTGQTMYIIAVPNGIEVNQATTGSFSFSRLCIARILNGAASDTLTFTFTFAQTKTGAARTATCTTTFLSGAPTQTTSWTWSDTTTVIAWIRVMGILADGSRTGSNTFYQYLADGTTPSPYSWQALGN